MHGLHAMYGHATDVHRLRDLVKIVIYLFVNNRPKQCVSGHSHAMYDWAHSRPRKGLANLAKSPNFL